MIYVASSWRNAMQPGIVHILRRCGLEVYDFRNPAPGNHGFKWSECDPEWKRWSHEGFLQGLQHPVAQAGFGLDFGAMQRSRAGLLCLPCGRSAHLEAGYFVGAGKPLVILLGPDAEEPELMYKMASLITADVWEAVAFLGGREPSE